jgi:hypothetical protein
LKPAFIFKSDPSSLVVEGPSVANKSKRLALRLLAGFSLAFLLPCNVQSASAREPAPAQEIGAQAGSAHLISQRREVHKRTANADALASNVGSIESKRATDSIRKPTFGSAKGPYYVDFRARTAASWGHAFVWFGKTGEREVEVAGLTPAGNTLQYMLGYLTWVPSNTGASYGDLDPEYLTASYRVYLDEPDAKRVFAYIKRLQASSPVWSAEISNCTSFIGNIASYMGLKAPVRWTRPEEYVNKLRAMNGGTRTVHLSSQQ